MMGIRAVLILTIMFFPQSFFNSTLILKRQLDVTIHYYSHNYSVGDAGTTGLTGIFNADVADGQLVRQ